MSGRGEKEQPPFPRGGTRAVAGSPVFVSPKDPLPGDVGRAAAYLLCDLELGLTLPAPLSSRTEWELGGCVRRCR